MSKTQVFKLHLWTSGDSRVGIPGEAAEVSAVSSKAQGAEIAAPSWLINAADYDQADFKDTLEAFRAKAREAFEVIWPNEKVHAVFDFELLDQRQVG